MNSYCTSMNQTKAERVISDLGMTLHKACLTGDNETISTLLGDPDVRKLVLLVDDLGMIYEYPKVVKELLKFSDSRKALFTPDKYGRTAVHHACEYENPDTLKELLVYTEGREGLMTQNNDGFTALHYLCMFQDHDMLKELTRYVRSRECFDIKDNSGETPFELANSETKKLIENLYR